MKILLKDKDDKFHEVEDLIIAVYSKMVRNCLKYSEKVISLPTIECEILTIILDWVRSPGKTLPLDNYGGFVICDLLLASEFLEMPQLTKMIISWLTEQLNSENAIELWIFARNFLIPELERSCRSFLLENLEKISPLELKSLDRESLNSLLMSDNLMLREEVVWNVIKEVTLTDPKDDTLSDLIGCVRFGLLDKKCWKKEVFPSTQFKRYIELNFPDAFGFESPVLIERCHSEEIMKKKPRSPTDLVFMFGGFSSAPTSTISLLDPSQGFVNLTVTLPMALSYSAAILEKSDIFLVGGWLENPPGPTNKLFKFNLKDSTLMELSSMQEARNYVGVARLDNNIFAVGGNMGPRRLRTTERYDITRNQWYDCGEMAEVRSDAGVAALNGKIYVIGGFNGHTQHASMEVLDPQEGTWSPASRMSRARSGVKAAVMNGKIYVVGGWGGGNGRLSCGEVFDPATGEWSRLPLMNRPRSNYSLLVTRGQLMVLGGYDGSGLTETTEILDETNMKWVFGSNMMDAKSATASCTVSFKDIEPEMFQKFRDFCAP